MLMVNVTEIIVYNDLVMTSSLHSCLIISSHHALYNSTTELYQAKKLKLKKQNRASLELLILFIILYFIQNLADRGKIKKIM